MDVISTCENNKSTKEYLKKQQLEDNTANDNKMPEKIFPWLPKFSKTIHSSIGSRNYRHLEESLLLYTQNILSSITASNAKSNDTVNIKNNISNMLIFFHFYWLDVKQDITDHNLYLNRMSTLLTLYIEMELKIFTEKKTSNHVKESSKIAAKILAALCIYLNNSEEHIFRVLLRIKYAMEKYTKICDHLFMKSFTNLTINMTSMTDVAYVRYLLAFKMWKKMDESSNKRERINKLALMLLGPRVPKLRDELLEFMPRLPANQENETLWLLQPNLFDLKQVHKHFLLFESKMDESVDLQRTRPLHSGQSYTGSQKCQVNPLIQQSNLNKITPNHEAANKYQLNNLQNHNISSITENKSTDQIYLQKKKALKKPLKKIREKQKKTIIIDLTGDEEISVPYKIKRKKLKRNLEYLKIMKKKHKSQKHFNALNSNRNQFMDADSRAISNKNSKSSDDKTRLDSKSIFNNKISNTESTSLISSTSLLNDTCNINFQKTEHLSVKNQMNICSEIVKVDEMQHDYNSCHSTNSKFFDQNNKEFKVTTNVLKENKSEDHALSHAMYAINSYSNPTQNKEALTQEDSAMETIPLFKLCQNCLVDQHSFKQESLTSTNCNAIQKSHKCCEATPVDMHDIKHLIIKKLKSINDHSSQITEIIKQKVCHQVNECPNCCAKIDRKPLAFTDDDIVAAKAQDDSHNDTFNQDENSAKCDTNIIYMLSDRNKRVYVVNHVNEHVMTTHAEKRMQCLDKSNDMCTVSTTFTGDQIVESSLYNQQSMNFDNVGNDYVKYSETAIKEEQRKIDCDSDIPISSDRIHPSKSSTFDINSFGISSSAEADYESQLKNFPKAQEINDITKIDCTDDLENISFVNNIQGETLEDFLRQSTTMSQINYDSVDSMASKASFADSNVSAVKVHGALYETFNENHHENDIKSTRDIMYNSNDRDKCVYVANHIDERSVNMNVEKRAQYLDNPGDICTVSTTFIEDQMSSSLDNQHVNFDSMRTSNYEDSSVYSETTMKEQQARNNCDTSMLDDVGQLYSPVSCAFDINSLEIDSKEANEIMKIDCTDDFENISFLHNIESLEETLEDVLRQPSLMSQMNYDGSNSVSKDLEENIFPAVPSNTSDFLSLKQSPFELDSLCCNVLSDIPDFEDNSGGDLQPSPEHEFFFAGNDRKIASPKQFEKPGVCITIHIVAMLY